MYYKLLPRIVSRPLIVLPRQALRTLDRRLVRRLVVTVVVEGGLVLKLGGRGTRLGVQDKGGLFSGGFSKRHNLSLEEIFIFLNS